MIVNGRVWRPQKKAMATRPLVTIAFSLQRYLVPFVLHEVSRFDGGTVNSKLRDREKSL